MRKLTIALLLSLTISTSVYATLVDLGRHTFDEETGFYWLDLTASTSMSYNEVSAQLTDPNSEFFGYRYGTESEVRELVAHSGYSTPYQPDNSPFRPEDAEPALALINLLGEIPPAPGLIPQTRGWYDFDVLDPLSVEEIRIMYQPINESVGHICYGCRANTGSAGRWKDQPDSVVGSFLVTSEINPIPIPAPLWLFGSGLLGLVGMAKRKKA